MKEICWLENRDKNKRLKIYCKDENEIQKEEGRRKNEKYR